MAPVMTVQFTDAALASPASDAFQTASPGEELVTFDLRVPERGASAAAARAEEAEVLSEASAEQGRIVTGPATADRPLGGRE
jgi:hypothetical protein